jgi:hypothetical protein
VKCRYVPEVPTYQPPTPAPYAASQSEDFYGFYGFYGALVEQVSEQRQGSTKIGSWIVCRVGEPILSRGLWGGDTLLPSRNAAGNRNPEELKSLSTPTPHDAVRSFSTHGQQSAAQGSSTTASL